MEGKELETEEKSKHEAVPLYEIIYLKCTCRNPEFLTQLIVAYTVVICI